MNCIKIVAPPAYKWASWSKHSRTSVWIKRFPNDIDSLKNAGAICIKLNEFDRAVLFFKRAFKLNSNEDVIAGLAYCLSMRALQAIKKKNFILLFAT